MKVITPNHIWICFDKDNGHTSDTDEMGIGRYLWWFKTREEALRHIREQNSDPNKAQLAGPFLYNRE